MARFKDEKEDRKREDDARELFDMAGQVEQSLTMDQTADAASQMQKLMGRLGAAPDLQIQPGLNSQSLRVVGPNGASEISLDQVRKLMAARFPEYSRLAGQAVDLQRNQAGLAVDQSNAEYAGRKNQAIVEGAETRNKQASLNLSLDQRYGDRERAARTSLAEVRTMQGQNDLDLSRKFDRKLFQNRLDTAELNLEQLERDASRDMAYGDSNAAAKNALNWTTQQRAEIARAREALEQRVYATTGAPAQSAINIAEGAEAGNRTAAATAVAPQIPAQVRGAQQAAMATDAATAATQNNVTAGQQAIAQAIPEEAIAGQNARIAASNRDVAVAGTEQVTADALRPGAPAAARAAQGAGIAQDQLTQTTAAIDLEDAAEAKDRQVTSENLANERAEQQIRLADEQFQLARDEMDAKIAAGRAEVAQDQLEAYNRNAKQVSEAWADPDTTESLKRYRTGVAADLEPALSSLPQEVRIMVDPANPTNAANIDKIAMDISHAALGQGFTIMPEQAVALAMQQWVHTVIKGGDEMMGSGMMMLPVSRDPQTMRYVQQARFGVPEGETPVPPPENLAQKVLFMDESAAIGTLFTAANEFAEVNDVLDRSGTLARQELDRPLNELLDYVERDALARQRSEGAARREQTDREVRENIGALPPEAEAATGIRGGF